MNVRQNFVVEMALVDENGNETPVAPELCKAITGWEVETFEEEKKKEDDHDGFLVPEGNIVDDSEDEDEEEAAEDDDESEDNDYEDDDDTDENTEPTRMLILRAAVNKAVLTEFKALTDGDDIQDLKVRIVYGNDEVGKIIKEFDCDTDAGLSIGNGDHLAENSVDLDLSVELLFDVYDSDTIY